MEGGKKLEILNYRARGLTQIYKRGSVRNDFPAKGENLNIEFASRFTQQVRVYRAHFNYPRVSRIAVHYNKYTTIITRAALLAGNFTYCTPRCLRLRSECT